METSPVVEVLRAAGARFAFVFGSRAEGTARPGSDLDVAAWFGDPEVAWWEVASRLPAGVDLVALDAAPLELAGRVALHGAVLFDDDPVAADRAAGDDSLDVSRRDAARRRGAQDLRRRGSHPWSTLSDCAAFRKASPPTPNA